MKGEGLITEAKAFNIFLALIQFKIKLMRYQENESHHLKSFQEPRSPEQYLMHGKKGNIFSTLIYYSLSVRQSAKQQIYLFCPV